MLGTGRAVIMTIALTALAAVPALAGGPVHPPKPAIRAPACLNQKQRRAAIESGKVIHLTAAIRAARKRVAGTVVRANICRSRDGLVYLLTVLARDGKVMRLTVDAVKGTLVGER